MYDYVGELCWRTRVRKEGKWGYLNEFGEEIIPCIYDSAEDFGRTWARVQKDGKLGYVDEAGRWIDKKRSITSDPLHTL